MSPGQPPTAWQPLPLGRDERERVARAIADIAASPVAQPQPGPSLASGGAGVALLFAYLAEAEDSHERAEEAVRFAEDALAAAVAEPVGAGLYGGLAGPAWLLAHLDGWLLDVSAGDPNDAVDQAVLDLLAEGPWQQDYDLINGLVGIGIYALERLPRPASVRALEAIVTRLSEMAELHPDGVTWHRRPDLLPEHQRREAPSGYYNLGVAHGVPGVIALLAAIAGAGVAVGGATRLLETAVDWLLTRQLLDGFPPWVAPGITARRARSAWCYGDPGVAATLLLAATISGRDDWRDAAIEIAARAAARPDDESGVEDAGICHGAAGLAHIFNRVWQQTGDDRFQRAAGHWLTRTLDLLPTTTEPGFLEGRAGTGLVLLAATGTEPAWDRILLLSAPLGE